MGEIIIANAVQRKPGYLYYIDSQGSICEAKMTHTGRPRKDKEKKKKPKKKVFG